MSEATTAEDAVFYPESDGQPLAETGVHVEELMALRQTLKDHYRQASDVYVGANMFVYYERGNPKAVFAPDIFVAEDVGDGMRRTFKLWEEGRAPSFVMEISSKSTWLEDTGNKKALCARLGVREYFLFDPLGDYLEPRLQGHRLSGQDYQRIVPNDDGSVDSEVLGLRLSVEEDTKLRCTDPQTGRPLFRPDEAFESASARFRAEAERQRAEAGRQRAEAERQRAEDRALAAERELDRLRAELARRDE